MSISIFFRAIRRFVQRCLKLGLPTSILSTISAVLRHFGNIVFHLQKRSYSHICIAGRRLMEAINWLGTPVIADKCGIVARSPGTKEVSALNTDEYLHIAQLHTIRAPDSNDSACLAEAMYSCVPSEDDPPVVSYHFPQNLPYLQSPNPPHHDAERNLATDTSFTSPTCDVPDSRMLFPHLDNPRIRPVMPEGIMRYEGRHKMYDLSRLP